MLYADSQSGDLYFVTKNSTYLLLVFLPQGFKSPWHTGRRRNENATVASTDKKIMTNN